MTQKRTKRTTFELRVTLDARGGETVPQMTETIRQNLMNLGFFLEGASPRISIITRRTEEVYQTLGKSS